MQAADKKLGMINIRSDDDASPKDVLDAMTPEEAAQVRAHAVMCRPRITSWPFTTLKDTRRSF